MHLVCRGIVIRNEQQAVRALAVIVIARHLEEIARLHAFQHGAAQGAVFFLGLIVIILELPGNLKGTAVGGCFNAPLDAIIVGGAVLFGVVQRHMQRQVGIFLHGVGILEGIEHALDKVLADAAIPVLLGGGVVIVGILIVLGGQGKHILKQLIARRQDADRLPAFHGIAESVLLAIAHYRDGSAAGVLRGIEGVIQLRAVN